MNWLDFALNYVPMPFLIADLVLCRDQRAAQRRRFQALRDLSREDQRTVGRALRRGESVEDARLVAPTLTWTARTERTCGWGTAFLLVYMATWVVRVGLAANAGNWKAVALFLVAFDLFAFLVGVGSIARWRAEETRMATLRRFPSA